MSEEKQVLYHHKPHSHKPRNINLVHAQERAQASAYAIFNQKAAVWTTWLFSTMEMFWFMDLFILVWMVGNSIGFWHFDPMPFPLLLVIINLPQLPLLPLLAISQKVIERKQELQADEMYATTQHSFADIEQLGQHLAAQDEELLRQSKLLSDQQQELAKQTAMLTTLLTPKRKPMKQEVKGDD